ncbi:MAG: Nif3-like dinuclear metal center hexameric protein [Candidatus Thorarchaeota archaeon]
MRAEDLYRILDDEFEVGKFEKEEWGFSDTDEYVTNSFKETGKGVVLDNTKEIQKVYTAVFPDEPVLDNLIATDERDILLFTHHAAIWDSNMEGFPFRGIPDEYKEKMREHAISLYSIHIPLDKNGPYSTATSLTRAIGVEPEREFFEYEGVMAGIIGTTDCKTVSEMAKVVRDAVGHKVKTWEYGSSKIPNQKVAVIGGGGNFPEIAEELAATDVKMYVTGVTKKNPAWEPSFRFHEICDEHKINVVAGTHYSTEKFACIAMLKFFDSHGMSSEFVDGKPNFHDYE